MQRSPCEHLRTPSKLGVRDRVLSTSKVRKVVRQARSEVAMFNNIVQLLLPTGQRRGKIAALEAEWIDFEKWAITLPRNSELEDEMPKGNRYCNSTRRSRR